MNVQIQMWILFIINLSFNNFNSFRRINFENLLFTILVYIVAVLSTHIFIKVLNESRKVTPLIQELNSIKASSEVFNIIIINQTYYRYTSVFFQIDLWKYKKYKYNYYFFKSTLSSLCENPSGC